MANLLTCLVTGATDGIGHQTAKELLARGFRVLVHGRSEAKAARAAQALGAGAVPVWGDFAELAQVRALAAQVQREAPVLDVLLNNAGVYLQRRQLTKDGHETTFQVNHLAHFLLTGLLLPQVRAAPQGRVVNVASQVHSSGRLDFDDLDLSRGFDGYSAYANSKLANVYFTHALARRLEGTAATTCALHPGVIGTKLLRSGFGGFGGASLEQGARTSVYCATAPELAKVSGRYYSDAREAPCARHAHDEAAEERLWAISARWTGLPG